MNDNFYVIATGNPSRFHGRLELPMSLQTRFATVLLQPIQPEELKLIIKVKAPDMADVDVQTWCDAFFEAKRGMPTLTTRALLQALKTPPVSDPGANAASSALISFDPAIPPPVQLSCNSLPSCSLFVPAAFFTLVFVVLILLFLFPELRPSCAPSPSIVYILAAYAFYLLLPPFSSNLPADCHLFAPQSHPT